MFATSPDAAAATATSAESSSSSMSNAELLAHQLDLHHKIQQQMQLQMEMSVQLGTRQSLTSSLAKVEPDLGDNVFDMLDDLIMIPSGAVAPERGSLSKQAREKTMDGSDEDVTAAMGSGSVSGSRDSLADILESLDMDIDDDLNDDTQSSGSERAHSTCDSLEGNDLDNLSDDSDNLELDFDSETAELGVDDDQDVDTGTNVDEHALPAEEDFVHMRRSSIDLLASMNGSTSSVVNNATGNICTLIWEGGLLGLRLRHSQSRMMPAVSKITGKSSIFGIHLVDVGDLLLRIGDRSTRDMEFLDAINYLKEVPKPCNLVFRRLTADPMAVKPVQPKVKSAIGLKLAAKFDELMAAENEKFPPQPAVKLDEKYEIKWIDGPLGISLIASKDVPYPLVTRITGKNRSPQVQDVQPGHYLVQIGSYNTSDGNFNTAIKFLQKVQKPVPLFFCPGNKKMFVRPDPADDEYDHIWEKKQPLCFTVRPNAASRMVVADLGSAKSIKVKIKGAPNNVAAFVRSGDRIIWINEESVEDLTFHESLLKLRTAKRPLIIRFKKGSGDDAIASSGSSGAHSASKFATSTSSLASSSTSVSSSVSSTSASSPPTSMSSSASESVTPAGAVSPPKAALLTPRSFINPLKKMSIALSNHSKENSNPSPNVKTQNELRKHQERLPQQQQHVSQSPQHVSQAAQLFPQSQQHFSQSQQHPSQLQQHSSQSQQHSSQLQQHSSQAQQHSSQLQQHSSQPQQHSSQPQQHSSQSQQHSLQTQQYSSQSQHHASQSQHHASQSQQYSSQSQHHASQSQQHVAQEASQSKYRHVDQEAKRSAHDARQLNASPFNASRIAAHGSRAGHHTAAAVVLTTKDSPSRPTSSSDNSSGNRNDTNHRVADTPNKLRTMEHGLRKSPLAKSSGDPIDGDMPLKPLSRSGHRYGSASQMPVNEANRSKEKESEKDNDVYEVVWPEGTALGLTLRVHPTTRYPVVARVTGTSNLKNIEHVSPGDILFAANNANIVPQPKFKQTLENLSRLPKPAVLRFRRASAAAHASARTDEMDQTLPRGPLLKDREYELVWRENANLGLVFSSDSDVPKVTKVDMDSGGPMLHKVSVGDILTWIGPMEISGSSFHSSMATLRAIKRPVVLRFYKRGT